MMTVCPQRILKEAVVIIETMIKFDELDDNVAERIDNNLKELQDLSDLLYKKGITNV